MLLLNGVSFDINKVQVVGGVQYPAGWFDHAEQRAELGVVEIPNPVPPVVTANQHVELAGFDQTSPGEWAARWVIRDMTDEEISAQVTALATAKTARNDYVNQQRDLANTSRFPFNGKFVAVDDLSFRDITSTAGHIALFGVFPPDFPGGWKFTDNTFVAMPAVADFKLMYAAMTAQGTANFKKAQELKARISQATTVEAVSAISWVTVA